MHASAEIVEHFGSSHFDRLYLLARHIIDSLVVIVVTFVVVVVVVLVLVHVPVLVVVRSVTVVIIDNGRKASIAVGGHVLKC